MWSLLLLATILPSIYAQSASGARPTIQQHHVGPIAIGADAEEIYEAFSPDRRKLVDLGYEGMLSPALMVRLPGTTRPDAVVVELVCNGRLVVWRIEIRDPALRTEKGIGVGSTVGELRAAYGLGSIVSGEGSVGIRVEELSATFALDQAGPGRSGLARARDVESVPNSVRITSVLLTR